MNTEFDPVEEFEPPDTFQSLQRVRTKKGIVWALIGLLAVAYIVLRLIGSMHDTTASLASQTRFILAYNHIAGGCDTAKLAQLQTDMDAQTQKMNLYRGKSDTLGFLALGALIAAALLLGYLYQLGRIERIYMQNP